MCGLLADALFSNDVRVTQLPRVWILADACLVHDLTICVSIACLTVAGAMLLAHGQCHDTYPCCEIYPYVSLADAKIHVFWAQILC